MKYTKLNSSNLMVYLMIMFTISTMTQSLYPVSLNRVFMFGMFLIIIKSFLNNTKKYIIGYLLVIAFLFAMSILFCEDLKQNFNDFVYFVTTVVWLLYISDKQHLNMLLKAVIAKKRIIYTICIVLACITLVSFLINKCYSASWGGDLSYIGFCDTAHIAASSLCCVSTLLLVTTMQESFNIKKFLVLLIFAYGIMQTGARVFMIPSIIIIFVYIQDKIKRKSRKILLYAFSAAPAYYVLLNSRMVKKMIFAFNGGYTQQAFSLDAITSGRITIWETELTDFVNSNFGFKLVGHGFDYVYSLNEKVLSTRIWAHNDFVNLLISVGIIGLMVYLLAINGFVKRILVNQRLSHKLLLFVYFIFSAFLNGMYMYQHLVLSFIFFVVYNYGVCIYEKK